MTQPKFEFDDDMGMMMAATSSHLPVMMGLVVAALAVISLVPWRPNTKYPYSAPIIVAAAAIPLSFTLDSHRVAIWSENNNLASMFVDFNTAQKYMSMLAYVVIGIALIFTVYRLISNWKDSPARVQTAIALGVLVTGLVPTPLQFALALLGSMLATLDSDKKLQPSVAAFICVAGMALEYSLQPQGTGTMMGVVPAVLAVFATPRLRGVTQLGWLGLILVFSGFAVQRITTPSLGTWYEKEKDQLATYRGKIGVQAKP